MALNKHQLLVFNHQILDYYEANDWIEVERFSDLHVRITRLKDRMKMDFWPSTNGAKWLGMSKSFTFRIQVLDKYLDEKFLK